MTTKKGGTGATISIGGKVGLGVAAAVASAAAGAFWLYGIKDSARNRKQVQSWMLKARADMLDGIEKLSEVNKATYMSLAEEVVKRYNGAAGATSLELARIGKELKDGWKFIQQAHKKTTNKPSSKKMPVKKASVKKTNKKR